MEGLDEAVGKPGNSRESSEREVSFLVLTVLTVLSAVAMVLSVFSRRYENMMASLQMISTKYGSVEGYVKARCGLSDEDIAVIKENLVSEDEPTLT